MENKKQNTKSIKKQATKKEIRLGYALPDTKTKSIKKTTTKKEAQLGYGLPETIWRRCRYNHYGNWILDMAEDKWCSLSIEDQQKYAKVYQENYAKIKDLPVKKNLYLKGIEIEMILVPPARFYMGSGQKEIDSVKHRDNAVYFDTEIKHRTIISQAYYLGKYPITKIQWKALMGNRIQEYFKNSPLFTPMENISWDDCQTFCRRAGLTLPSEAQWEHACRAGVYGMGYKGDFEIKGWNNAPGLDSIAWYAGNSSVEYEDAYDTSGWAEKQYEYSKAGPQPVGKKEPNAFGLYDMLGNVWEWCMDSCDWESKAITENYKDDVVDPESQKGIRRILRGGAWCYNARYCRCATRFSYSPFFRVLNVGFRVLLSIPNSKG
ncbi:MAG: formylglycine-generating enzyme family protein [Candidatus Brocadiae bacterium]|nr:formylglycine-generating enzyme family protein [Candidatus Brocadiia bacterium]